MQFLSLSFPSAVCVCVCVCVYTFIDKDIARFSSKKK